MGTRRKELIVVASVSANNGERQKDHEGLWDELQHRIDMIVREHRYEEIIPMKF